MSIINKERTNNESSKYSFNSTKYFTSVFYLGILPLKSLRRASLRFKAISERRYSALVIQGWWRDLHTTYVCRHGTVFPKFGRRYHGIVRYPCGKEHHFRHGDIEKTLPCSSLTCLHYHRTISPCGRDFLSRCSIGCIILRSQDLIKI